MVQAKVSPPVLLDLIHLKSPIVVVQEGPATP